MEGVVSVALNTVTNTVREGMTYDSRFGRITGYTDTITSNFTPNLRTVKQMSMDAVTDYDSNGRQKGYTEVSREYSANDNGTTLDLTTTTIRTSMAYDDNTTALGRLTGYTDSIRSVSYTHLTLPTNREV